MTYQRNQARLAANFWKDGVSFRRSRAVSEGMMKGYYDLSKGRQGAAVPIPPGKTRITIRLDNEILDWFRSQVEARGGGSYQAMINDALKEHMKYGGEKFESFLRQIIREELKSGREESSGLSTPPGRLGSM